MRKVDDGEKRKEKNVVLSGHYVIASSLPPERRPLGRRTLVPIPDPEWQYRVQGTFCHIVFVKKRREGFIN